jgi:uncharacterized protein with GYD domain
VARGVYNSWIREIKREIFHQGMEVADILKKIESEEAREGIKVHGIYWTLGRYDSVAIFEAPDEKITMKMAVRRADNMAMEPLVAVPIEEAKRLAG